MSKHPSMPHQNKRRIGTAIAAIAAVIFLVSVCGIVFSSAAEKVVVPDSITLSEYNRTAGPVTFTHKDHGSTGSAKPACSDCHHTTPWDQTPVKCSTCHLPFDDTAAPTDTAAFHKLCIGCHKTQIEHGDKRIDLACESCHAPEK